MRRLALATMAVLLLVGAYGIAKVMHRPRNAITAVATPAPVRNMTPVDIKPGQRACQDKVALDRDTRVIRFYSGSPTPQVPRLRITVRGDGYRADELSPPGVGPGTGSDGIYDTRIPAPARSTIATVCVTTASATRKAILAGSQEDRVRSRSRTSLAGGVLETRLGLLQLSGAQVRADRHPKQLLQRAAAFQPPFVGWLSLALVLLVIVVGVPAAAVYATLRALRDDGA